jgi:hypothetical protein
MENLLKDYYSIKNQIDELTKESDLKKGEIISYLKTLPNNRIETDQARFSIRVTPTYVFGPVTKAAQEQAVILKEEIKKLEKLEIDNGTAKLEKTSEALVMTKITN